MDFLDMPWSEWFGIPVRIYGYGFYGIYGFYEYNPLYDDQANSDGKKVAWKINQIIKKAQ